jgi:hypothetical protein
MAILGIGCSKADVGVLASDDGAVLGRCESEQDLVDADVKRADVVADGGGANDSGRLGDVATDGE